MYHSWRDMLASGLDVLVVALPHNKHVAPAEAAAAAGVHVMMEKPIATTLEDAERIMQVCESAGVLLSISFVHRFREEVQAARRWIEAGQLGPIQIAHEQMIASRGPHLPAWVNQKIPSGGGVLMYSAIHGIDRLRWLIGSEVQSVSAQTRTSSPGEEVEDGVSALITFANGAVATLSTAATTYKAQFGRWETELYGSEGMLRVRTRQFAETSGNHGVARLETTGIALEQGEHYNFARQAAAFVAAIRGDAPLAVSGSDGLRALEIALAIYDSAERGLPVRV